MQKQKIYRAIFAVSAVVFLISSAFLVSCWWGYRQADSEYEQIAGEVVLDRNAPVPGGAAPEDKDRPALSIDFAELRAVNRDIAAWIDFPGQDASYPVVQGTDNEHYLNLTFNGTRNSSGTIFADSRNDGLMTDGNTIIYGHNMKNGSMFGFLKKYLRREHYEQYPYFDVYLPDGAYRFAIISCARIRAYLENYQILFTGDKDRQAYINRIRATEQFAVGPVESDGGVPEAKYVLELLSDEGEVKPDAGAAGSGAAAPEKGTVAEESTGTGSGTGAEKGTGTEGDTGAGSGTGAEKGTGTEGGTGAENGTGTGRGTGAEEGTGADGEEPYTEDPGGAPPLVLLSTCSGSDHEYRFVVLAQVQKFYPAD